MWRSEGGRDRGDEAGRVCDGTGSWLMCMVTMVWREQRDRGKGDGRGGGLCNVQYDHDRFTSCSPFMSLYASVFL